MTLDRLRRAASLLAAALLLLCGTWPLLRFVQAALGRIGFPFELEWMEGGILGHIQVVRSGEPLYRAPSMAFTPFIYAPLYYYASAAFSLVLGEGYLAPRLVSLLSILGCFVLIGWWAREETGDPVAGVAAAGAFSATYGLTDYWFDIARADSFFLLLLLAAFAAVRRATTVRRAVLAGVFLSAACLTKQTGTPIAVGALAWLAIGAPRMGAVAAATCAGLAAAVVALLYATSGRWFWFYLVELPSRHHVDWPAWKQVTQTYLWAPVAPMALSAIATVSGIGLGHRRRAWSFHAVFVVTTALTGLTGMLHTGGYPNVLLPTYAAFSVAFGLQVAALRQGAPRPAIRGTVLGVALLLIQVALLDYDPSAKPIAGGTRSATPSAEDRAAGVAVISRMQRLEKPIWVTSSAYYQALAGQEGTVTHTLGLVDVLKGGGAEARAVHRMVTRHVQEKRFRTIVLDRAAGFLPGDIVHLIKTHYRRTGSVLAGQPSQALWPRGGAWVRPDEIWVPR